MLLPSSLLQLKTMAGASSRSGDCIAFAGGAGCIGAQILDDARVYVDDRLYALNAFLRIASGRARDDHEAHEPVARQRRDAEIAARPGAGGLFARTMRGTLRSRRSGLSRWRISALLLKFCSRTLPHRCRGADRSSRLRRFSGMGRARRPGSRPRNRTGCGLK